MARPRVQRCRMVAEAKPVSRNWWSARMGRPRHQALEQAALFRALPRFLQASGPDPT